MVQNIKALSYCSTITLVLYHTTRCTNRKCYFKVLYTRLHNYGSGQCIYVHAHELFVKKLNIKIETVALSNHQSLQAEHGIKSLSMILTKYWTEQGQMWP